MKPELSSQRFFSSYFVAIYYNGAVAQLNSSKDELPEKSNVRFMIHCDHKRSTSKGYGIYTNKVFDNANKRIEDNTFFWEGFKCNIQEEESWGDIRKIHVRLLVDVWDRLGVKETLEFENESHDGSAFRELFMYLDDLVTLQSHTAVKFVRNLMAKKDEQIRSLENIICELEKMNK